MIDSQEVIIIITISFLFLAVASFIFYWLGKYYLEKRISHYKKIYQKAIEKTVKKNERK